MTISTKLNYVIKKYFEKTKIHQDSPCDFIKITKIKPVTHLDISVINYFKKINGEEIKNIPTINDFLEENHQNFKKLSEYNKLKILFLYIKTNTKNGLYKRESLTSIGKYFGNVDKNTIKKRLDVLEATGYIRKINDIDIKQADNTYKVLKKEYEKELK